MRLRTWLAGLALVLFSCAQEPASGNAVETGSPFGDAMRWYAETAAAGDADAQFLYGLRLEKGLEGEADPSAAEIWYRRAADQGHPEAQFKLALLLTQRDAGSDEIAQLYEAAARGGLAPAQFNLGVLLLNGAQNIAADRVEAFAWIALAAEAGLAAAEAARERLMISLPAAELTQGEARICALREELGLVDPGRTCQ